MCVPQIVSLGCIRLTVGVCIGGGVRIGTGSLLQFESQSLQPCRVHSLCPPSLLPPPPPSFPTPPDPRCHTLHLFNVLFYIQTLYFLHIQCPVDKHCFSPVTCSVSDEDGEFLLIETAHHLPSWLRPETAQNRVRGTRICGLLERKATFGVLIFCKK